jgi:hypothetical protein
VCRGISSDSAGLSAGADIGSLIRGPVKTDPSLFADFRGPREGMFRPSAVQRHSLGMGRRALQNEIVKCPITSSNIYKRLELKGI